MLDISLLRKDLASVVARLETRAKPQKFLDVAAFTALESERKQIQVRTEELQSQRNQLSKQIGQLKAKGESADAVMTQVAQIKTDLEQSAARLDAIQPELEAILLGLPNLPHPGVPVGESDKDNQELRRWGEPRKFDFEIKDHVDVGEKLGLDFATGVKLAGARFTAMRGPIAQLHRALSQFMLDTHTREHGYTECYTPYIVNAASLCGLGLLFLFVVVLFAVSKGGQEGLDSEERQALYLIPTSEVSLTNFVRDEILAESQLPMKLTAHTPYNHTETNNNNKNKHNKNHQHQNNKVEMV